MKLIVIYAGLVMSSWLFVGCAKNEGLNPVSASNPQATPTVVVLPTAVPTVSASNYTVTTFAGTGAFGDNNGPVTNATFGYEYAMTTDSSGNIYISDLYYMNIREITASGVVSTVSPTGFCHPAGICFDGSGNLYVCNNGWGTISKLTSNSILSTFAGTGSSGFANGTGTSASFNFIEGIGADATGNLYVNDTANYAIRKITPAGVVTTLAGTGTQGYQDGPGSTATFGVCYGLAVDPAGNVYVPDRTNNVIRKIDTAGVVSTLAGSGVAGHTDGVGSAAVFFCPSYVALDKTGNLYVTDGFYGYVRQVTQAGVVTTIAGTGAMGKTNGAGSVATFNGLSGITLDASGNIYVTDANNLLIRKIQP